MNELEQIFFWQAIFFIGKIVAYVLAVACMIKFLWS